MATTPANLIPAGQDALEAGDLPADLAEAIARLGEVNQTLMVERWTRGGFSSARHAERYALAIYRDENSGLTA
ncbi:hypothetical protein ACFWXA_13325 [Streptomyces atroolivaceus]|uniref:hypothetical protein n=1 Tax=Streptomyces atroolivaceus TaxID=66869 RepID=UPI0036497493